jgi:hypothetical protein
MSAFKIVNKLVGSGFLGGNKPQMGHYISLKLVSEICQNRFPKPQKKEI